MDNGDIIPEIMKTSPSHHHLIPAQCLVFNQSLAGLPSALSHKKLI